MMRHDERLNFCRSHRRDDLAHVIEKVLFLGDLFDHRPEFAALAEKIVVGIDE